MCIHQVSVRLMISKSDVCSSFGRSVHKTASSEVGAVDQYLEHNSLLHLCYTVDIS